AGELPAGRGDVIAARLARRDGQAAALQDLGEAADALGLRAAKLRGGERVEGYEVELGAHSRGDGEELARMRVAVVHTFEHYVVEVKERRAHAHHHHVGHRALAFQQAVREPELAYDLGARQIAVEALFAGRAEGAVEHTARLARNAQRAAVRLGNEHRFDGIRFIDLEQPFARAIFGGGIAHDHRRIDARRNGQALAQRLRKIAHARELALAA